MYIPFWLSEMAGYPYCRSVKTSREFDIRSIFPLQDIEHLITISQFQSAVFSMRSIDSRTICTHPNAEPWCFCCSEHGNVSRSLRSM